MLLLTRVTNDEVIIATKRSIAGVEEQKRQLAIQYDKWISDWNFDYNTAYYKWISTWDYDYNTAYDEWISTGNDGYTRDVLQSSALELKVLRQYPTTGGAAILYIIDRFPKARQFADSMIRANKNIESMKRDMDQRVQVIIDEYMSQKTKISS